MAGKSVKVISDASGKIAQAARPRRPVPEPSSRILGLKVVCDGDDGGDWKDGGRWSLIYGSLDARTRLEPQVLRPRLSEVSVGSCKMSSIVLISLLL